MIASKQPGPNQNATTVALLFAMILIAFIAGWNATKDLEWPADPDIYRDIASAQTIADGEITADSAYLNEKIWYNPLLPALIAAINKISGIEIHILSTQSGAYLNLLAPITFALMVWVLFGPRVSLAATAGYLFFVNGNFDGYLSATYSAWLYPNNFTQAFFYLLITLLFFIFKNQKSDLWFVLLGIATGIMFLGHAAPALLFGIIVFYMLGLQFVRNIKLTKRIDLKILKRFFLFVIPALVFALPFIYILLVNYGFKTVNYFPSTWIWEKLRPPGLPIFIAENLNIGLVFAPIGLIALFLDKSNSVRRSILFSWIFGSAILFIYTTVTSILIAHKITFLPSLVPSVHYYFYLKATEAVLFGYGFIRVFDYVSEFLISKNILRLSPVSTSNILLPLFLIAIVASHLPAYLRKNDFTRTRDIALSKSVDEIAAYHWIRKNTANTDVFLSSERISLFVVNPAGRKTVCTRKYFSNPYVDWRKRYDDTDRMFKYLMDGNPSQFDVLADQYKVRYVLFKEEDKTKSLLQNKNLEKYFQSNNLYIFKRKSKI